MQIYISVKLEGMVDYLFCIDCYAHSICAALCTYINRSSRPCVPEVPYPHMLCKSLHAKSFFWIKAENSEVLINWHFPDCVQVIFSFPDITVFYPCVETTSKTNQCCPSSSPFLLKLTSPCTFHFHCEINWNIFLCLEDCCLNLHRKFKKNCILLMKFQCWKVPILKQAVIVLIPTASRCPLLNSNFRAKTQGAIFIREGEHKILWCKKGKWTHSEGKRESRASLSLVFNLCKWTWV